jgi:hypothetical protein
MRSTGHINALSRQVSPTAFTVCTVDCIVLCVPVAIVCVCKYLIDCLCSYMKTTAIIVHIYYSPYLYPNALAIVACRSILARSLMITRWTLCWRQEVP